MGEIQVAFLRAINVGGRRVEMDVLSEHLGALDDVDVLGTFLASGNVVVRSPLAESELADRIAARLEETLGFDVPTIVRSMDYLVTVANSDVFADEAAPKHRKLYVTLLSRPLDDTTMLDELASDVDTFRLVDRDVFWLRDIDAGESLENYALEKAIDIVGTRRTMNTVQRIVKKFNQG